MIDCACTGPRLESTGPVDAKILIVSSGATAAELESGILLGGRAGLLVWNLLKKHKLDRADVRIINTICGLPAGADGYPTDAQLETCSARFERELKESKAEVILVLGGSAMRRLTGIRGKIDDLNGYVFPADDCMPIERKVHMQIGEYKTNRKCTAASHSMLPSGGMCGMCQGTGFVHKKGDPKFGNVMVSKQPVLPPNTKYIIPTLHPETVRMQGYRPVMAFTSSASRAIRASQGNLQMYDTNKYTSVPMFPGLSPGAYTAVAFDIETDIATGAIERMGIAVSYSDGSYVVWTAPWNPETKEATKAWLSLPNVPKIAHNITFDVAHLKKHGVEVVGPLRCTMQIATILQPDLLKGLGRAAPIYLDLEMWKHVSQAEPARYNAADAGITLMLYYEQLRHLTHLGMVGVMQEVMSIYPTLMDMTEAGIKVDTVQASKWSAELYVKLGEQQLAWKKAAGQPVNYLSPKQLAKFLYDEKGFAPQFNKYGRISTDEEAAKTLKAKYPKHAKLFDALMAVRETSKMLGTYASVEAGSDGCIHPGYLPVQKEASEKFGVRSGMPATGRLASNNPNIQNQPKDARVLYIPHRSDQILVEYDYNQLELRIIAALSGDTNLATACAQGVHEATMKALGIANKVVAKGVIYGTAYGAGPRKLAKMLQMQGISINEQEASMFQRKLFERYHKWFDWRQEVAHKVKTEYKLTNAFGRVRPFYGGDKDIPSGLDFEPQSNGADMVIRSIVGADRIAKRHGGRLLTCVHDSFLQEVSRDAVAAAIKETKAYLERPFHEIAPDFWVPVTIKTGENWRDMKEVHNA